MSRTGTFNDAANMVAEIAAMHKRVLPTDTTLTILLLTCH